MTKDYKIAALLAVIFVTQIVAWPLPLPQFMLVVGPVAALAGFMIGRVLRGRL